MNELHGSKLADTRLGAGLPLDILNGNDYSFNTHSYKEAQRNLFALGYYGFAIKKSGLFIPTDPQEVATVSTALREVLDADMYTRIPHYFLALSSPKKRDAFPSHIGRTIVSASHEPQSRKSSIYHEIGAPRAVRFRKTPPYAIYTKPEDDDLVSHLFVDEVRRRSKNNPNASLYDPKIAILAGVGRVSAEVADTFIGKSRRRLYKVQSGSTIIDLGRIALSLVGWGEKNPTDPLYIISTARLVNANPDAPPQAYLLDRLFKRLKLSGKWLGLCAGHGGAIRYADTGAVIVQIRPEEYKEKLKLLNTVFNVAVENMANAPGNKGLF